MGDVTVWQEHVGVVDPVAFIDDYHQTVGEELKYKRKLRRLKKWGGIGLAATLAIAATGGTIFGVSKHHKAQQTKVVKQEQDNAVLNALMRSVVLTEVIHSIDSPQIASIDILRQLQAKKNRTGVEDIWLEVMQNATEEHAKLRKELNAQAKFPDSYKRLRSRRLKELEDERADKREFYSWSYGSRLKNHTALLLCQQEEALHQKYSKLTDEELKYMAEWEVLNIAGKYNPEERAIFLSKGPSGLNAAQKRGAPSGYTEVDWDR